MGSATRKDIPEASIFWTTGEAFGFDVRLGRFGGFGPSSASVGRALPILRLGDPKFGIKVRFRLFGSVADRKVLTFLDLSAAITKG
jgi:hypothetical protein